MVAAMSRPTLLEVISNPEEYELTEVWEEQETGRVIVGDKGWTPAYLVGYLITKRDSDD